MVHTQVHEQANVREIKEARRTGINKTIRKEPGYVHGGTHVHSELVFKEIPFNLYDSEVSFEVSIPFIVSEPGDFFVIGGMQFFVGNATAVDDNSVLTRYDVGNAAAPDERIVTIQDAAYIPRVGLGLEIFVYVLSAIGCCVILFLLEESIRHRRNQIMKLSQGPYLTVLLFAALFATASVWLINPTVSDLYCQLFPPLIFIPIQLIYAIILGRVWRTQRVLSPLLQEFYETKSSRFFSNGIGYLACSPPGKGRTIRATVTSRQLATVVFIFTLPQVIIQVLALILQPRSIQVYFNDDASVGRMQCRHDGGGTARNWLSLVDFGYYLIIVMNILVVVVAQSSKRLPSLFNELSMIGAMSSTNMLVLLLGISVLVVTAGPTTSPNVSFFVWATIVLSVTLNSSIRLMLPKLCMVWRGETVLVSKLVADHRRAENDKKKAQHQQSHSGASSRVSGSWTKEKLLRNVAGFSFRRGNSSHTGSTRPSSEPVAPTSVDHSLLCSSGNPSAFSGVASGNSENDAKQSLEEMEDESGMIPNDSSMVDIEKNNASMGDFNDESMGDILATGADGSSSAILDDSVAVIRFEEEQAIKFRPGMPDDGIAPMEVIDELSSAESLRRRRGAAGTSATSLSSSPPPKVTPVSPKKASSGNFTMEGVNKGKSRRRNRKVLVCDSETPSRTLVVPMMKLQEKLLMINGNITTGIGVAHSEWEDLRAMAIKLGDKFQSDVSFEWEDPSTDF